MNTLTWNSNSPVKGWYYGYTPVKGWYCGYTGTRLKTNHKAYRILDFIRKNNGATKYEVVTEVLGIVGNRVDLRGYYSCAFADFKQLGWLTLNTKTHKYYVTESGMQLLSNAKRRS
jgi:hypothetical protein